MYIYIQIYLYIYIYASTCIQVAVGGMIDPADPVRPELCQAAARLVNLSPLPLHSLCVDPVTLSGPCLDLSVWTLSVRRDVVRGKSKTRVQFDFV